MRLSHKFSNVIWCPKASVSWETNNCYSTLSPIFKKELTFLSKESLWPNIRPLPQLSSTSLAPLPKIQSIQIPIPGSHLVGTPTLKSPLPNASLDFQQHRPSSHLRSLYSSLFILHRRQAYLSTTNGNLLLNFLVGLFFSEIGSPNEDKWVYSLSNFRKSLRAKYSLYKYKNKCLYAQVLRNENLG